jgi:hypothetical protein
MNPLLKTVSGATRSRVRIPVLPPLPATMLAAGSCLAMPSAALDGLVTGGGPNDRQFPRETHGKNGFAVWGPLGTREASQRPGSRNPRPLTPNQGAGAVGVWTAPSLRRSMGG